MKINSELYASIDENKLMELLDKNPALKAFVNDEISRMVDSNVIDKCSGCQGCGHGCSHGKASHDVAYLTTALLSIFNFYLPTDIKEAINVESTSFVES